MMNLKKGLPVLCFGFLLIGQLQAQEHAVHTRMFRIFEDNDFLNITGNGSDDSYTNGTKLDFFYSKKGKPRFIDRLLPVAGNNSNNIFGWSITQLMVTPDDIVTTHYQPDDYPYAGALFITHSLYSYNAVKKYSFQTELVAGIRGPASFASETQTFIHSLIDYQKPMGWNNQLTTYPLLNINFTTEKQIYSFGHFLEIIGGAQINAGSFIDAAALYPLIRIGKMAPYFDGLFSQFGSYISKRREIKTQFYLFVKPEEIVVAHNALMHGERINEDEYTGNGAGSTRRIRHRLSNIQAGAVLAQGNFSISYSQTHSTEYNKGLYHHNWGNISISCRW
jgi:hypothetical protein